MRILAIDTTMPGGSVALVQARDVVAERRGSPASSHSERLMPDIMALLDEAGWRLSDIDVFAVASGPGGLTGLRVGLATVQGLALVNGRPVAPVPVLDAVACAALPDTQDLVFVRAAAVMDARRREVFTAVLDARAGHSHGTGFAYRWGGWTLYGVEEPSVGAPAAVLDRWRELEGPPWVIAGDAVELLRDVEAVLRPARRLSALPALAGIVGQLGADLAERGAAVAPHAVHPVYVRRPDAEVARDRERARPGGSGGDQR